MILLSFLFLLLSFNLPLPLELFMTVLSSLPSTHNVSVIGMTPSPSYKGSVAIHSSTAHAVAFKLLIETPFYKGLTPFEKRQGSEALYGTMNSIEYAEKGYQLLRTFRDTYIFVPKHHDMPVILYTPKHEVIEKPTPPAMMECKNSACDHGWIETSRSVYACNTCAEINMHKVRVLIYEERMKAS